MSQEQITPQIIFENRRRFLQSMALVASGALLPEEAWSKFVNDPSLKITKEDLATSYNNFYEFSLEKNEVKELVKKWDLKKPWNVTIKDPKKKSKVYSLDELVALSGGDKEERIYRFRCVEAWAMVVPWRGFPLANLIKSLGYESKYLEFKTFDDPKIGPNISKMPQYTWPYTEGLTFQEAMHPLTFIATGMYGKDLPKQNGAPLRLVVPWKYGFKSIKSIVSIEFKDEQPKTLWNLSAPNEYGFYANVNPKVSHPRWSQATERILDGSFFPKRQPTLMFNGYEKEVAQLYKDLDLTKFY